MILSDLRRQDVRSHFPTDIHTYGEGTWHLYLTLPLHENGDCQDEVIYMQLNFLIITFAIVQLMLLSKPNVIQHYRAQMGLQLDTEVRRYKRLFSLIFLCLWLLKFRRVNDYVLPRRTSITSVGYSQTLTRDKLCFLFVHVQKFLLRLLLLLRVSAI